MYYRTRERLVTVGIIVAVIALLVFIFFPRDKKVIVNELYWENVITFETLETFYGEGWDYPVGARVYDSVWEYYDTEEILIGYDEEGYAIYEYEDIYAWYYYYEYDEWVHTRSEVTSGTIDEEPYWGSFNCYYDERQGYTYSSYYVEVTENRQSKEYETSYENWLKLRRGEVNNIKVSVGYIVEVE